MMSVTEQKAKSQSFAFLKSLVPWVIGGFIFGVAFALTKNFFGWELSDLLGDVSLEAAFSGSTGVAFALGGILIFAGAMVFAGFLSPRVGMKMDIFEDTEHWREERGLYGYSSVGCLAWGAILVLLALSEPLNLPGNNAALAVLALAVIGLVISFWKLLVKFDELWHDINRIACEFAFYGALLIGGGWSSLAHLGFVEALAPLGWISLLTGLSLIGAVIGNAKRGTLKN